MIPSLDVGGTERQLQYLARGLSKTHAISILCTRREGALAADMKTFAEVESLLDEMAKSGYVGIGNDEVTGAVVYTFGQLG